MWLEEIQQHNRLTDWQTERLHISNSGISSIWETILHFRSPSNCRKKPACAFFQQLKNINHWFYISSSLYQIDSNRRLPRVNMISSRLFTSSCFNWTQIVNISSDCKISVIIFHFSEAKGNVRVKRTLQGLAEYYLHPPASRRLAAEHWVQIMLQEQLYKRQTVKGKSPDPLSKYGRENFTVKKTNFELNFFDCVSFYRARPWFFVRKSSQWTNKRKRLSIKKHENWKK